MAQAPADSEVTAGPMSGVEAFTRAIKANVAAARGVIETDEDPVRAFHVATDLAEAMRELSDECAALRADQAYRIRAEQSLTLAVLAETVGLSRSRADQLIRSSPTQQERERRARSGSDEGRD